MGRLEFRHVRAFLAVARHLHFARAADELDMAPPALTRQIQEAERLLGVRLFHRSRRAVALSAAGEAYLGEASAALEHLQRGRELAALAERGELGRIDAGRLDVAYVRPPLPLPGELRTVTLQRDVFVAAVPADSPFAAMATIKAAALAGARFAVPEQELGTLEVARRGRFAPMIAARPGGLLAVLACVSVNGWVAVIPDALARCVSLPGVVYRPLAGKPITSELALACRRFEKAPAVRAFLRSVARAE
ncbi:LysR family transcriptional regulator [Burkholderia ubonensis]|uniref:LysR family transcriptional regulator n=1 Tax=Burkholderia ubonensis TaxID=101571 RepID=UPI00075859E3|nr:LysR family transcriptional regulator [Burkholderia ubonensis]KWD61477.1 LysR family transcriptional regulator [Burkholderia ubonensis]KWD64170.1 LysR family transcriptional regulator [Burkholderia ubonensis]